MGVIRARSIRGLRRLALLGCLIAPAVAAEPKPVADLHYGEALFYFYQDDTFAALTRLLAARETGKLVHHALDGELLLGGLQLSYGMHVEADVIFRRLLDDPVPLKVRNRAWYYLGRMAYEKGDSAEAEVALRRIEGPLSKEAQGERQLLIALGRLDRDDPAGAQAALASWTGTPAEAGYAQYNLGLAQLRAGNTAAGLETLDALGQRMAISDEGWSLRDKTNLTLGYALLRQQQPARAQAVLRRVRQQGPFTARALLGLGLASTSANQPLEALTPLILLKAGALEDPAVQEAYLALPYLYGLLGDQARAVELYQAAITAFEGQIAEVGRAEEAVRAGALRRGDGQLPKDLPGRAYLVEVTASHGFRRALQSFRELRLLQDNFAQWTTSMTSFDDMLAAREAGYAQSLPKTQAALARVGLPALRARLEAQRAEFARVEAEADAVALATAEERAHWNDVIALEKRLATLPTGAPELDDIRDRARRVKGLLLWRFEQAYPARLWEARKALREVEADLDDLAAREASLVLAQKDSEQRFSGYRARIAQAQQRTAALRPRLDALVVEQADALDALALAALAERREALEKQISSARFGLARVLDEAARPEGGGR